MISHAPRQRRDRSQAVSASNSGNRQAIQPTAALNPRVAQLARLEELVNRRNRTANQTAVIQGVWAWDENHKWWEEDQRGYIYDPETGDWQWGDEGEHADPEQVHATYRQSLLNIMDRGELLEYFEDPAHASHTGEYLGHQTHNLPGNQDITEVNAGDDVFDYDDDDAQIAEMADEGLADPVATLADGESFVASGGASTCVIVFLRIRSSNDRTFLGASHLTANDLSKVDTAIERIRAIYDKASKEMGDGETVTAADAYAIGGQAEDEVNDLMDYVRLIQALKEMPEIRLAGARLPASEANQYVDARMDADTIEFGRFDQPERSAD